jgi:hypothetical protein
MKPELSLQILSLVIIAGVILAFVNPGSGSKEGPRPDTVRVASLPQP